MTDMSTGRVLSQEEVVNATAVLDELSTEGAWAGETIWDKASSPEADFASDPEYAGVVRMIQDYTG